MRVSSISSTETNPAWRSVFTGWGGPLRKDDENSVHARMTVFKKKLKSIEDVLSAYAAGDDVTRAALRKLMASLDAYHWAGTPPPRNTAEGFRQHLLISVIDQWPDFRDTLLYLNDVTREAEAAGVEMA